MKRVMGVLIVAVILLAQSQCWAKTTQSNTVPVYDMIPFWQKYNPGITPETVVIFNTSTNRYERVPYNRQCHSVEVLVNGNYQNQDYYTDADRAQVAAEKAQHDRRDRIILLVLVIGLVGTVIGAVGAYSEYAVFFDNGWDVGLMLVTLAPVLWAYFGHERWLPLTIGIAIVYNIVQILRTNPGPASLWAPCIFIGRVVVGYCIPLVILSMCITGGKRTGEDDTAYQLRAAGSAVQKAILVGGMMWFIYSLINGEKVRYMREVRGSSRGYNRTRRRVIDV